MTWHASPEVLHRFGASPETLDPVTAVSLEQHLMACETCRQRVAEAAHGADHAAFESLWFEVVDRIDAPRPAFLERLLRRLGVSETNARLVSATRSLQVSWLSALAILVAAIVAVARGNDTIGPFLVVAPLLPVGLVAAAFAIGSDPAGETGGAAPLHGAGLVMRRAVAVEVACLGVMALGALALPGIGLAHAAWILPALGLSLGALALATWMRIEIAAVLLASGWCASLAMAYRLANGNVTAPHLAPLAPAGQLAFAALTATAIFVLVARRDTFATIGSVS